MFRPAIAASVIIMFAGSQLVDGAIINVPADQATIQAAINIANPLDEIIVAPGTYVGAIDLMGKAITVRSSGGPNVTTIDGNGTGSTIVFDDGEDTDTVIEGFTITGGTGTSNGIGGNEGGGLYCFIASPTIRNCIITANSVTGPGSGGGGMSCFFASPRIVNCLFDNNVAQVSGGAVFNESGSAPIFLNCTFANNTAPTGAGLFSTSSTARLISCISWFNNDDAIAGNAIVTYSNIQTGFAGEGNINLNPQFVDLAGNDLRLSATSPCIDAGDSTAVAEELSIDIDEAPRGVDDPLTVDTGKQVLGLVVDMGCYEFQVPCNGGPATCIGDITDNAGGAPDGIVDVFDLLEVLSNWGVCP